jgi:hypothetical protein
LLIERTFGMMVVVERRTGSPSIPGSETATSGGAPTEVANAAAVSSRESAELDGVLSEVAGHLNAQHARLVDVAVRLSADERLWAGPGVHSLVQYLAWKVGVSPARARQVVDIAERAGELSECVAAMRAGELSIDHMAIVARRVPWWADGEVCEVARETTVSQLGRALAAYPFPDIPHPDDRRVDDLAGEGAEAGRRSPGTPDTEMPGAEATGDATPGAGGVVGATAGAPAGDRVTGPADGVADRRDRCWFHVGDDGRFRLQVETDAETGMVIEAALAEARDAAFGDGHRDITWVDALREVAERSLDSIGSPSRRHRFRINLHLDAEGAVDPVGARLPDEVRRHIGCDGMLTPVFTSSGLPVSVGRARHIVPDRTRRLVLLRDQGCRVPGCTQHRFIEVHHIVHWLDGGNTDTDNLICLCPHHHRLHHRGRLGIVGHADTPGGITFTSRAGEPIARSGARPEPPGASTPPPIGTYRHPEGGRLDGRWLYFNPPPTATSATTN